MLVILLLLFLLKSSHSCVFVNLIVDLKVKGKTSTTELIVAFYVFMNIGCMHVNRSVCIPSHRHVYIKRQLTGIVPQVPGRQSFADSELID